jgi:hypothetical protein
VGLHRRGADFAGELFLCSRGAGGGCVAEFQAEGARAGSRGNHGGDGAPTSEVDWRAAGVDNWRDDLCLARLPLRNPCGPSSMCFLGAPQRLGCVVRLVCGEAAPLSEDGAALRVGIHGGDGAPPSGRFFVVWRVE